MKWMVAGGGGCHVPHSALEESGVLRDDGNLGTKLIQIQRTNVDAINRNRAACYLDEPEERRQDGGLPATGTTGDADFHATSNFKVATTEHEREVGPVPKVDVVELD